MQIDLLATYGRLKIVLLFSFPDAIWNKTCFYSAFHSSASVNANLSIHCVAQEKRFLKFSNKVA